MKVNSRSSESAFNEAHLIHIVITKFYIRHMYILLNSFLSFI